MNVEQISQICKKHDLGTFISEKSLGQGENHHNKLITTDTQEFVLRYALRDSKNIKKEFEIMQKVPEGFAPKALAYGSIDDEEYSLQEFIPGKHPENTPEDLHKLIKRIAEFHKITQSKELHTINMYHKFLHEFSEFKKTNPELFTPKINTLIENILDYVKKRNDLFVDIPKQLVHQDLILRNCILQENNNIIFIDWEWGDYTDPARDLASFYFRWEGRTKWQVCISKETEDELLDIYCDITKQNKELLLPRIRIWQLFIGILDSLWFESKVNNWKETSGAENLEDYKQGLKNHREAIQHILKTN